MPGTSSATSEPSGMARSECHRPPPRSYCWQGFGCLPRMLSVTYSVSLLAARLSVQ